MKIDDKHHMTNSQAWFEATHCTKWSSTINTTLIEAWHELGYNSVEMNTKPKLYANCNETCEDATLAVVWLYLIVDTLGPRLVESHNILQQLELPTYG